MLAKMVFDFCESLKNMKCKIDFLGRRSGYTKNRFCSQGVNNLKANIFFCLTLPALEQKRVSDL
jgi:hypothetical protein